MKKLPATTAKSEIKIKENEKYFGPLPSFKDVNKEYNDLVLSMEDDLRNKIQSSKDPLATSITMARIGNYIDFAALSDVNTDTFLELFIHYFPMKLETLLIMLMSFSPKARQIMSLLPGKEDTLSIHFCANVICSSIGSMSLSLRGYL